MTATLRLFTIEARRSVALWFVPPLAALIAWGTVTTMRPDGAPTLWSRTSIQLGMMFVVAALIMCGVGAWAAGRNRRRQTEDLLATMPRPVPLLDIAYLAGTILWGLVACLVAGGAIFVVAQREATWGGPAFTPLVVGLLTVVAGTAVGYLGGTIIPSRFAAPVVAVAFAAAMLLVGTRSTAVAFLSPLSIDPRGSSPDDVFYRAPSVPVVQMGLWLVGLAVCAFAAVALYRRRTLLAFGMFAGALVLATSGAIALTQAFVHPPWERIYAGQPTVAYAPVCAERSIPVCVHPAYAARLDEYADRIGPLVAPLADIPGAPTRVEQRPSSKIPRADQTLSIVPGPFVVPVAAHDLVANPGTDLNPAQRVIAFWMLERVGENPRSMQWLFGAGQPDARVAAAVARFSALGPDAQRAWLMANFEDLRAGRVGMDELP